MSDSIAPAPAPRPAVAGIVRSPDGRILLGLRNPQLKFMGGHYAFPGGSVDAEDNAGLAPPIDRAVSVDATALARELFEETGLLIVRGALPSVDERRQARQALLAEEVPFQDLLDRYGLQPDVERFRPAGLFVTPETSPRRFHARYYLIDKVSPGDEELIPGELIALDWFLPADARHRWRRKEIDVAPPVAFVLKQLATLPVDAALERLRALEPLTGDHAHCHEARIGIRVMPLRSPTLPPARHTNCLMIGETELYIIDPAATSDGEQQRLIRQLEDVQKHDGAQLAAVLLTHGHRDHTGSAPLLRERYGIPIWAHQATADKVEFPIDRLLLDNEVISIPGDPGWSLRCLHTPGHHPGHLCFLEESSGTLICGDMVASKSSIVIAHGHGGDMSDYLQSMERLLSLDCDLIIPSHGFMFNHPHRVIRKQIDHRFAREAKIQAAVDAGARGIDELLAASYDDVPREMWQYAEYTLKAHLVRLGVTDFEDEQTRNG